MTPEEFAAECRETSRKLRRLPATVRVYLRRHVKERVAQPAADDIRKAGRTVYARRVAPTARARAGADPTVVVGGARRVASGGARARDLVFGANFGGGGRVRAIPARPGRAGYRRVTTNQFAGRRDPFVFATVGRNLDRYLEAWAGIVDEAVAEEAFTAEYERQTRGG